MLHASILLQNLAVSFLLPAPTKAPNVIITRNSSATSLRVKWSHVSKKDFNGKPVGYEITYYPVGLKGNISYMTVSYTTNYTELTNLTAFTTYIVNVSAVSSGGVGPGNWTTAQTDDAGTLSCLSNAFWGQIVAKTFLSITTEVSITTS